jgi:peptide/nickel transport system substrate-binding protein
MAAGIRRPRTRLTVVLLALIIGSSGAAIPCAAPGAEAPRRGGVFLAAIGADAPSLDPHQESTFATIELGGAPLQHALADRPLELPQGHRRCGHRVEDRARRVDLYVQDPSGHQVHDGSPLTATDVKATYDKIVFPPDGVRSVRKNTYTAVASVEAPDPSTVVFKLKFPSASLLANLASPWDVIYPKKYLDKDPNYFKANVVGSGPFKFKSYTRGSTFEGERNPDYFIKDRPYLDGYKFYISPETSVRAAALRSGRAWIEFRTLPEAEVTAIRKQLGDKVVVQETPATGLFGIAINQTMKPFTDVRVRKALTLGFDRYTRAGCCTRWPAWGTSGDWCVRPRSGRWRSPSSRSSRGSDAMRRRIARRPDASWPRRATPMASRSFSRTAT